MWIVRLALRRPYTFVVAALVLLLLTPLVLWRTPTDIFPSINIPVVSIVWTYTGLDAQEIEQRINYNQERSLTTTVNDIEHIESNAYNGIGIIKVYFREGTSVDAGVAQVTAICQTIIRSLPPGTTPPLIIRYSASTVPILQYSISSPKLSEQEIFDYSANQIRVGLPRCAVRLCPGLTAARPVWCRSTSICPRSKPKISRPSTSSMPSMRRTWFFPAAQPRSAGPSTPSN